MMINITPDTKIACICEGSSEKAIIDLLLDDDKLLFSREQLIDNEPLLNYMDSSKFTLDYLGFEYEEKIMILIIADTNKWKKIKPSFSEKISGTYFILTTPELEMIMIHALNLYDEYRTHASRVAQTKQKKPSAFLSQHLKKKSSLIKSKKEIDDFFKSHSLIDAIETYSRKTTKKDNCYHIKDLLK